MPFALFSNDEQISKAYQTEQDVWRKAKEAGLVVEVPADEEAQQPKHVLDEDYCIKPCPPDAPTAQFGELGERARRKAKA